MTNKITPHLLNKLRQEGDSLADQTFLLMKGEPFLAKSLYSFKSNASLIDLKVDQPELLNFLNSVQSVKIPPEVAIGAQKFFKKYAAEILAVLGFYSLPYCYAGAKGARVLYHSKKIRENPGQRLLETAEFVFQVMAEEAFEPEANGDIVVLKVRLMHAAARFYARQVIDYEEPINQEDNLGTLLSFSLLVIRGLKKSGIPVSKKEESDYLKYWNAIGRKLGIKKGILPESIKEASVIEREVRHHQFQTSKEGIALTDSLLQYMESNLPSPYKSVTKQYMSYMLGEEVSRYVGLAPSQVTSSGLSLATQIRNGLRSFSEQNFKNFRKTFDKGLKANQVKPDFEISFK